MLLPGLMDMRGANTPLESVIDSFMRSEAPGWEPKTESWYKTFLVDFRQWLRKNGREGVVGDIDPIVVASYIEHRRQQSPFCGRGAARTLKRLGNWLAQPQPGLPEGLWSVQGQSVLARVKVPSIPKDRRTRQPFRDGEVAKILETAGRSEHGARDQAIVGAMLGCGLRLGECLQLRLEHIDWKKKVLRLPADICKGKEKGRVVRMDPVSETLLDRYVRDFRPDLADSLVFLTAESRPFTYGGFQRVLWRLKQRGEVRDFKGHRARHTWATNYLRTRAGSVADLMDEGGWSDLETVQVYAKAVDVELRGRAAPLATVLRKSA